MPIGPTLGAPSQANDYHGDFAARVVASFARAIGAAMDTGGAASGRDIYFGDFALLTHKGDAETTLNYGNALALRLWDCDWDFFTALPSARTAPPDVGAGRDQMMQRVARDNFVSGYSGRRISATGRLFLIHDVTIWRLLDETGNSFGVGAWFRSFEYL